jgi:hypothetical protein
VNTGSVTARNVILTDALPRGLSVSSESSGCHLHAQSFTCTLGRMAPGAVRRLRLTVHSTRSGRLTSTLRATYRQPERTRAAACVAQVVLDVTGHTRHR